MHAVPAAELTAFSFDRISLELQNTKQAETARKKNHQAYENAQS